MELGVALLFLCMFIRKLKNRSGSISVQIISKSKGKYQVVKTIGSSKSEQEIEKLYFLGKQELERISIQPKLFVSENDTIIEHVFDALQNANIKQSVQKLFSEKYMTTLDSILSMKNFLGI